MFFTSHFNDTHFESELRSETFAYSHFFLLITRRSFFKELFITWLHFSEFHTFISHNTQLLRTHFTFCNDSGASSVFMFVSYFFCHISPLLSLQDPLNILNVMCSDVLFHLKAR